MMAAPGGTRPGNVPPPPNYNPNELANNMQNLHLHTPNQPPVAGGPRPPPPFGQQPPPFAGQPPASRPGPQGSFPRGPVPSSGPQQYTLPPNVATGRPGGPPPGAQPSSPFGSRPPPPAVSPPSMAGGPAVSPPIGGRPSSGQVSRPASPFMSAPSGPGSALPPSNGPPTAGLVQSPGAPRFPPTGGMPQPQPGGPPTMVSSRSPPPPTSLRPPFGGSPPSSARPSMFQANPPFSTGPQNMQPPPSSSQFSAQVQGMPRPSGSPFGAQPWQVPPRQAGPSQIPGSTQQPPMMYGMPPPISHQAMAQMPPAIGHTGPGVTPTKIDPNQIPRPFPNSSVIIHETRQGNQANPPPPATFEHIVNDTGNCSPRYMRCTVNQIPCTTDLLNTSAMQLALLVQPLALPHPNEEPIQVVDFGDDGPVRCSRCKGYINPFMKFIDQGRKFICNLCGYTDETPRDYHCNLGPDGRRRDADERPELCKGTVEFVATKEYMVRDPMPAVYFFLIDVSMNAIQTGATAAACGAISQVIADLPEGPRTMVGVATFDSTIHFYNLKRALQQPLMLIVPDIQEVYTPLQSDVIVQLSEGREHLDLLLDSIPSMFKNNRTADSAFGAAVKAAFLAMKSTGGKLLVFQSVLPGQWLRALLLERLKEEPTFQLSEKRKWTFYSYMRICLPF
ncbi:hypothetical protein Leryth_008573, partial [Lithospermum erythrorhizon]